MILGLTPEQPMKLEGSVCGLIVALRQRFYALPPRRSSPSKTLPTVTPPVPLPGACETHVQDSTWVLPVNDHLLTMATWTLLYLEILSDREMRTLFV